ncbi:hypothetical protein WJX75_002152 [Coccomyxa subellipsoidea]|uniref:Nudix hydrolase domain-containing protein n=1 Tax=Coccomyxa subellipsoidea TaxID=248742 RepID=A0ABR2YR57_9CHLO
MHRPAQEGKADGSDATASSSTVQASIIPFYRACILCTAAAAADFSATGQMLLSSSSLASQQALRLCEAFKGAILEDSAAVGSRDRKPGGTSGPGGAASGADFLQAEGWQPGDGVRPTPQQELLLLKLIASPQHREVDKKKIVLMACVLGVDVVQTLERAGLGMDWLTDVGSAGEMLDDLINFENPLETYWENMSTLFEDGVKGRRKFLEQPAAAAKKGFGGGSSGGGGGSGKGRKSKPRKVKSSYMLAAELVAKERKKRLQQEAAEAAAENAVLERLMDDWSPEEREAYTMASYHWDIAMAATLLGVYTFVQLTTYGPHADEHSTVSFTSAVELLMAVRAAVWRSIDIAHGRGNASGRPEVLYALQGMLAHKAFDALQKNIERLNAYAAQGEYSSGWVGQTEKQMLSILSEESPPSLPLPPAYAFVPPACGGLSIVEEILARQVAGSVEAWEKLGPHQRMERLVTPGWSTVAPLLIRSIRRIEREEDQTQAAHLLGIEYDPALDGEAQPFADSLEMQYRQPSGAPSDAEGPTSAEGSASSATGDWARLNRPVLPPNQEQRQGQGRPQQSRDGTPPNGQQAPKQAAKEAGPDRDLGIFTPGKRRSYADQLLTEGTYLAKQLLPHDQRHWKAAGILLFSHAPDGSLQLLLGRIDSGRHQPLTGRWRRQEGWWILGGKRDPTDFSAEATAVREMTEETAGILSGYHVCGDDLGEVLWYPPGHYAVFPYQLQGRADIPRRYARLRASRGRVKGRRRLALVRQAGHPKPMSSLAWIPLSELIAGRCRLHWILEDMLRRTPLLPYLLQMERLGASATPARVPPTSSPGPPYRQGQSPTISSPKGSSTRATNSRAEVQSAQSDIRLEVQSARSDWTYVDRSGWTGTEAAGLVRPRPAGPEPGTPRNGAAAPGEGRFAAIAQAAREFLDASGAAPEEEGTQRETAAAGGPLHSNSKPLLRPRKRRRPRLKRVQMKRGA